MQTCPRAALVRGKAEKSAIFQKAVPKTSFFQPRGVPVVPPAPKVCAGAHSSRSRAVQAIESSSQGRQVLEHGNTVTSDGDAGDGADDVVAGGEVMLNQRTSNTATPKPKGGKQLMPKAKPKPKPPGRPRPQSADPQQTKLSFK